MKNMVVGIVVAWCIMSCQAAHSEGPEPTCANCPGHGRAYHRHGDRFSYSWRTMPMPSGCRNALATVL